MVSFELLELGEDDDAELYTDEILSPDETVLAIEDTGDDSTLSLDDDSDEALLTSAAGGRILYK